MREGGLVLKDFYKELDDCLSGYETRGHYYRALEWCANKIDWCYKWKKLPIEQIHSLADRVTTLFNEGYM